jgi:uncharacterized protein YfkK (UPF0435 family)
MIDITKENVQKIFIHILNFHSVKHNVNDWTEIYNIVCSQRLSIPEINKIAQHISIPNMYTNNVVTEQIILNNLNQCKTEVWEEQRKQQIRDCPYFK